MKKYTVDEYESAMILPMAVFVIVLLAVVVGLALEILK
jgi:hypothetical protein